MSDKPLESGQSEGTGLPNPKFQSEGDQQASTGAGVQALTAEKVQDMIARALQSDSDRKAYRSEKAVEKKLSEVDSRIARYEELRASGMTPDEATFRLRVEEVVENTGQPKTTSPSQVNPGTITSEEAVRQAQALLKETGLENDPELTQLFTARAFKDGADLVSEVLRFTARRLKTSPAPNPAAAVGPSGGSAPTGDELETLNGKLATLNTRFEKSSNATERNNLMQEKRKINEQIRTLLKS